MSNILLNGLTLGSFPMICLTTNVVPEDITEALNRLSPDDVILTTSESKITYIEPDPAQDAMRMGLPYLSLYETPYIGYGRTEFTAKGSYSRGWTDYPKRVSNKLRAADLPPGFPYPNQNDPTKG